MPNPFYHPLSRRTFLAGSTVGAIGLLTPLSLNASEPKSFHLRAAPGRTQLVPAEYGETPVWCYSGTVPGREIRVRQGERLRILVENGLNEETTVHWHGMRVPNSMDGVPHLNQKPIAPGKTFTYEFDALDAGTFWYHPHQRSAEQVGRGLYGALIVEEETPPAVDRELVWILDDWRLDRTAAIDDSFDNLHDMSHGGRIGNTVTINGKIADRLSVRSGERIRLRLINAANARIFGLDFRDLTPTIIALDGQPVTPHRPEGNFLMLGPAMRADLIIDMTGAPNSRTSIVDRFYPRQAYRLVDLEYDETPLRENLSDAPIALPPNPLAEPDLLAADRHEVIFNGGMMGGRIMAEMGGRMDGDLRQMMHDGLVWFVNGKAAQGHVLDPLLTLKRDRSHIVRMVNATAWHHPIHLHGHSFRVLSRNGKPTAHREWQDTVLMAPREEVEIALVADNPGDWMFHCHILEHQQSGMMGVVRVA